MILVNAADENLMDEDLLEIVNAGLLPATVTITQRASLWSQILDNITPYSKVVIGNEGDLAVTMRQNNPKVKQLVDEFVKTHAAGTSFGNTLIRKCLQSGQLLKDATSESEMKKFNETVGFFKRYASSYNFDCLMIVAQGYQESMLEQSAKGPKGAVGIMQVKPATAAAPPISIPDVWTTENNIHAGVKILRNIADNYFSDPKIGSVTGCSLPLPLTMQARIESQNFAKKAPTQGVDPNKRFGNVELLVSQNLGPVTVEYVSSIYKYYVAYKLVVQQGESLQ